MSKITPTKESSTPLRYITRMVIAVAALVFIVFLVIILNPKPVFIAEPERNALVADWAKDVANNGESSQPREFFINSVGFAAADGYIDSDEFNIISMNYEDFKEYEHKRSIEESLSQMGYQDDVFPELRNNGERGIDINKSNAAKDLAVFQNLPERADNNE